MSTILTYSDRLRSYIQHENNKPYEITDPIGLDEGDLELKRNKTYHGIFYEQSNDIQFVKAARQKLLDIHDFYGIQAKVRFWVEERHPKTDEWVIRSDGYLSMKTRVKERTTVSFKYDLESLLKVIKSRHSQKLELERLETIDGVSMLPLKMDKFNLVGRKILLKSLLETNEEDYKSETFRMEFTDGNTRTGSLGIPVSVTYESDFRVNEIKKDTSFTTTPNIGLAEGLFYHLNDVEKTLDLKIALNCKILELDMHRVDNAFMKVDLVRYHNGADLDLLERITLYTVPDPYNMHNHIIDFTYSGKITLLKDESLGLQWYGGGDFGKAAYQIPNPLVPPFLPIIVPAVNGNYDFDFDGVKAKINIDEHSVRENTKPNCILPYELANRLITIMTSKDDIFYSEALGRTDLGYKEDGFASLVASLHGQWARNFTSSDERYKAFTTSFKEFMESYGTSFGLGLGVEKIGFKQRLRIEKKEFFYNRNTTVRLGKYDENGKFYFVKVSNEKETDIEKEFYSEIEIGSDKGGEYEEAMGLDEYNTKTSFSTIITETMYVFKSISKYRKDPYGLTFAARDQKARNPTKDSKYDRHIWLVDLKRSVTNIFQLRLWEDDFEKEPTGVYSPETAFNLRLSPVNTMLLYHGWKIAGSLTKYPFDYIRYGSSVANSKLTTKLRSDLYPGIGGVERSENGSPIDGSTEVIQNKDLSRAISVPALLKFEYPMDYELRKQILGTTKILGKEIPNIYGVFEYMSQDGTIKKGHLEEIKGNKEFKFKEFYDKA